VISAEEQHVLRRLAAAGTPGEKISESTTRTADILARDEQRSYLIEVKTRTDDQTVRTELAESGMVYRVAPLAWTSTVATIFDEAADQLSSFDNTNALKLVWLCVRSARGANYTLAEQARHTLYGISRVAGSGVGAKAPSCYYFHESVFFRHKNLVGVVIDLADSGVLCLNDHSPRVAELRSSKLGKNFGAGVLDPAEQERLGRALIADCDVDRKDSAAVLKFVSEKYGIQNAVHFNLDEHAAFGVVGTEP